MPQTHFKKDALSIVSTSVSLLPFLTTLYEHLGRQEINYCSWINTILKYFLSYFSFITCHLLWPSYSSRLQASLTLTLLDSKELYVLWFFLGCFEVFERVISGHWLLFWPFSPTRWFPKKTWHVLSMLCNVLLWKNCTGQVENKSGSGSPETLSTADE